MGGFPSHDAPGFLFTTAVQNNKSGGTTELCLVPLLKRYFNDNNKRLKDSVIEIYFKGPPNSTQLATQVIQQGLGNTGHTIGVNSNNANGSSGLSSGMGTPPASPLSACPRSQHPINITDVGSNSFKSFDIGHINGLVLSSDEAHSRLRALNAYKKMEHLLGEIEASFFTSTRVIYQSLDAVKGKVATIQAARDSKKRAEDAEFLDVATIRHSKTINNSESRAVTQESPNPSAVKTETPSTTKSLASTLKTAAPWYPPTDFKLPEPFDINTTLKTTTEGNLNPLINFSGAGKAIGGALTQLDLGQTPLMRPVPCAICIVEPEGGGRTRSYAGNDVGGNANTSNTMGTSSQAINGAKIIEWTNLQGRRLNCIGYLSCFGLECADVVAYEQQFDSPSFSNSTSGSDAARVRKQSKVNSYSPTAPCIPLASGTTPGVTAAAFHKIPRLGSCSDEGCDVYLDVTLENEQEFSFLLEPIIFLASMTFRSQFMTCSMWQKPISSKDVEEAYYNFLQLLNVHIMLSPERYQQLKLFYDHFPLIENVERLGFSDKPSTVSASNKSLSAGQLSGILKDSCPGGTRVDETVDTCESSRNSLNGDLPGDGVEADIKMTPEAAGGDPAPTSSNTSALRRSRRARKRGPRRLRVTREQDEIYRFTTCRMPKCVFYELHTGQYGVEVVFEGGALARFMKYVTETAAFETVKGNYVRCDLGPLMKERRHLLQSYREALQEYLDQNEEDERLFGSELISTAIQVWLKRGSALEEQHKIALQNAQAGAAAIPIAGVPNTPVVNSATAATLMQTGMLPPMFQAQLGGANIPVLQNSASSPMPLIYNPGLGYVTPRPGMYMQQPYLPHAQIPLNLLNIQFQLMMPNSAGHAYAPGAPPPMGFAYPHQPPPFHFVNQPPPPPPAQLPQQQQSLQQQHQLVFPFPPAAYSGVSCQYVVGPNGQLMAMPVATPLVPADIMLYNQYPTKQSFSNILTLQRQHLQQQQQQQPASLTVNMNTNENNMHMAHIGQPSAPLSTSSAVPTTNLNTTMHQNSSPSTAGGPERLVLPDTAATRLNPTPEAPNVPIFMQQSDVGARINLQSSTSHLSRNPTQRPSNFAEELPSVNLDQNKDALSPALVKPCNKEETEGAQDPAVAFVDSQLMHPSSNSIQWFVPNSNNSAVYNQPLFNYSDMDQDDTEFAVAAATAAMAGFQCNSNKNITNEEVNEDEDNNYDRNLCDPSHFFFSEN